MKFFILVLLFSTVAFAEPSKYHYDPSTGKCTNEDGKEGLNAPRPEELFKKYNEENNVYYDVDAECVDFKDFDFNKHIGLSYPKLAGWDMRGANFDHAKFHFANMQDCNLKGADLSKLSYGYTNIQGKADEHTKPAAEGCNIKNNEIKCRR